MIRPKILIVEDDLIVAKNISMILEGEGYETVSGITNVDEAKLAINQINFVLVLIDVNLRSNSDGVELGTFLLKKDTIPYIYITSYSDYVTLDRIKVTRPYGIIIKPFKTIDIKSTVSIVLSNFKHKNIDVFRVDESLNRIDEVPFILKNVINYINENISEKIEIQQLTEMTKWTHHHFIRTFTKYINQTPYQYILNKKIDKAKAIISESDTSLAIIAIELGFSSYSNFCNAFKKVSGKTPEMFRKLHKINKQIN